MVPVKRLRDRSILVNWVAKNNCLGIAPDNLFWYKASDWYEVIKHSSVGIVPVSLFVYILSVDNLISEPISVGMVPEY